MYSSKISVDAKDGAEEDQRKPQDILRYLSLRCYNVVANEAQMEKLVSFEREAIKLPKLSAPKPGVIKQNAAAPKPGAIKSCTAASNCIRQGKHSKVLSSVLHRR